jgi:hypothetical protein
VAGGARRVVGVDVSPEMVRLARERVPGTGVREPRPSAQLHERYPDDASWLSVNPGFIVFSLLKR